MARHLHQLDLVIKSALQDLVTTRSSWHKSEVIAKVINSRNLGPIMRSLHRRHGTLELDILVLQGVTMRVDTILHARDRFGLRKFECYLAEGDPQRLWFPLRYATQERLLVLMQSSRRQARSLRIKIEAYQLFYDALELKPAGTTLDDIYDDVAPSVQALRAVG
jgi:hypothetical protein